MIYLIGGSPSGGKSILSRKLSKKLNIPCLSTDNIRQIILPYFKSKERDKKFPFEKMFDLAAIDKYFLKYNARQIVNADIVESRTAWPGIKQLITHLLDCKMDYIVEGVYLLPSLIKDFKSNRNVKILFLAKLDEEKIYDGFHKSENNDNWIKNIKDEKTIRLATKSMSAYGVYFERETKKYNFKFINTEYNFSRQINTAVHFLTN
ncbi:hypothetical protein KAJ61_00080 [Candidatus Parcubacteria bacterium]|nr:hypothetical protein [Candidatus Parcubacteria bacterium]